MRGLIRRPVKMLSLAEKSSSCCEQDVAPHQKQEAKVGQVFCKNTQSHTSWSFKTILRSNKCLQALELPAPFVRENGHNFQATVSLQGPSGGSTVVRLTIKLYPRQTRVYFGQAGWKAFVVENGFQVGQQLLFSLVSMSTFIVHLLQNSASPAPAKVKYHSSFLERQWHSSNIPASNASSSCHGMSSPNLPELRSKEKADDVSAPAHVKNDVVYNLNTLYFKQDVEILLQKFRCPHFVTMIGKSNLRDIRSCTLNVPREFQRKYGTYFSKFNVFQGRSGRMMEVCFSGTNKYERFSQGWKAFHKENGIKLGDVLLVSLRAPAFWFVQVVDTSQSQSEEQAPGDEFCNIEHRE